MKITFNIDCTPEEARDFFGLPDVKPMQDAVLARVGERMAKTIDAMTPEALLKTWLPASVQGVEQLQKMFWSGFTTQGRTTKSEA